MLKEEVLVTRDLTKRYSNFTALEKLNISITKSSCVGFLGPNGAGKSTTMKILTGLIKPTNGDAFIFGYNVMKETKQALSKIGAVVETPEFPIYLTPNQILSYFGKIRGLSNQKLNERIDNVLETVKMTEWRQKKIGKFSKGMKQRIALASALLHNPEILILDEPTSGLDPRGRSEIKQIIKSLKNDGKTIFMSSHLLPETQEICDKVALIDKGRLLHFDRMELLNNSENSTILIEFINAIEDNQLSIISKLNGVLDVKIEFKGIVVEFDGGDEQKAELLKSIEDLGFKVTSFRTVDSKLESLYLKLVTDSVG
jgi:ABC-2 type transport system ATP-binding protein